MGRNRKKSNQQLPKYVYINRGRYVFILPGQKAELIGKCSDLTISDAWQWWNKRTNPPTNTVNYIISQYLESEEFKEIKAQKHVIQAFDRLKAVPAGDTTFSELEYQDITPGVIRQYLDFRNNTSGNREIAYFSSAWSWCRERDIIFGDNPCKGVRKKKEKPKKKYITHEEYKRAYDVAPKHIQVAMELAYLCRMRPSEALDVRVKDCEEKGLNTRRLKGSNDALTVWTPRLKSVIDMGLEGCLRVPDMPIVNRNGSKLTYWALNNAWRKVKKDSGVNFKISRLKGKGTSDFGGDKKDAGGWKTERMVDIYDVKRIEVEATE